ncbi:pyridoxamine 5'-phosphate oxidase family protein [Ostreibacterium oceani]|uniref:Pyridoxamine 5'-phosphate oxidase family protein n=1 Tax=Ostreibacterium oceani TaxID=2654998 RepID=A0A6N7EZ90_9GAMM|nr:pyridoxamine 5'-phosphate oxidase family protein [Ostreibacterium oceani]MPV86870.1 pyridoxamine 5'-phosphate oxidase family protein [Ostreibacterium oceani]
MLTDQVKNMINRSVLCWLATSHDNQPNVSPKEIFTYHDDRLIIANIASPQSVNNIQQNNAVCVSFIDILSQKGYKVTGTAQIIMPNDNAFTPLHSVFSPMVQDKFTILSMIDITPTAIYPILAPSYTYYPDTSEIAMIEQAKAAYFKHDN